MKIAVVSGGFDPIHSGHIAYLKSAAKDVDKLIVCLNSDAWLIQKKGQYFLPFNERKVILENIAVVSEVIDFEDDEIGSAIKGLKEIKSRYPQDEIFFCNGGDRDKNNIPEMALSGINFSFNVGGSVKKNSSSWILKEWSAPKVERNWGHYRNLYKGKNFMVKELVINPQSSLSMQRHKHRSETWNLVSGNAELLVNWATTGDPFDGANIWKLSPQNPVDIPKNYWHKGRNNTDEPAHIVEIWKGDTEHLTEDDIERWYSGEDTE